MKKDEMLNILFNEMNTGSDTLFNNVELEHSFNGFIDKHFSNLDVAASNDAYTDLAELIYKHVENAFKVGYNTAIELTK